ncbi:hypothetical protein AMJ49_04935, partial [Parcubacteria bacterium DG_74_2]
MFYILGFFWFIRTTKAILFWLYLWQLKEYHIGRFKAHFHTAKGKQLFLNKLIFLKIVLFFVFFGLRYVSVKPGFFDTVVDFILLFSIFMLLAIYLFEAVKAIADYSLNKLIKPVFTRKMQFLVFVLLGSVGAFLYFTIFYFQDILLGLLVFDILTPVIVSFVVLFFQPLTVLLRNQIIKKATKKREKFKNLL